MAEKWIFRNSQSPGDIVMLTAAVRDLHKLHPNKFITDLRTSCSALWENNPYIKRLDENDPEVKSLQCEYPLIHRSNSEPWHFIHGFSQFLGERLGVQIWPTHFKGDIHLSLPERQWMSQVQETTREPVPYWIIVAGGKRDFTIKWWARSRFQSVVTHFRNKILFVQVGEASHEHPPLDGVLDLRGKTDLRQLVRLVHHAQGVVCPVTLAMHLAAAVPVREDAHAVRPCVVIAGGREPSQWEAYPHHQFLHTIGALRCCNTGGCWKSRTVPLDDHDKKNLVPNLCVDVSPETANRNPLGEAKNALSFPSAMWPSLLPRCMDMIPAADVIQRIELYFVGGATTYLTVSEREICSAMIPNLGW